MEIRSNRSSRLADIYFQPVSVTCQLARLPMLSSREIMDNIVHGEIEQRAHTK